MGQLILYSMAELLPVIRKVLPKKRFSLVEIGSEAGTMTREILEMVERGAIETYTIIEPYPIDFLKDIARRDGVELVCATSREGLEKIPLADVYLIDGDHNYYTVFQETSIILNRCKQENRAAILLYHDVCWPWDRRDLYYTPEVIPSGFRHDHSYNLGVTLEHDNLTPDGFRSAGTFAAANHRGGPRNGVRTGIEDALQEHEGWELHVVPAIFGLGVVIPRHHPEYSRIVGELSPFDNNELIGKLERNRIELFLAVQKAQDELDRIQPLACQAPRSSAAAVPFSSPEPDEWRRDDSLAELRESVRESKDALIALDFLDLLVHRAFSETEFMQELHHRLSNSGNLVYPFTVEEFEKLRYSARKSAALPAAGDEMPAKPGRYDVYYHLRSVLRNPAEAAAVEYGTLLDLLSVNAPLVGLVREIQKEGRRVAILVEDEWYSEELVEFLEKLGLEKDRLILQRLSGDVQRELQSLAPSGNSKILHLSAGTGGEMDSESGRIRTLPWPGKRSFIRERGEIVESRVVGPATGKRVAAVSDVPEGMPPNQRNINPISPDVVYRLAPSLCHFFDWCLESFQTAGISRIIVLPDDGAFLSAMLGQASAASGILREITILDASEKELFLGSMESPLDARLSRLLKFEKQYGYLEVLDAVGCPPDALPGEVLASLNRRDQRDSRLNWLHHITHGALKPVLEARILSCRNKILSQLRTAAEGAGLLGLVDLKWSGAAQDCLNRLLRDGGSRARVQGFYFSSGGTSGQDCACEDARSFWDRIDASGILLSPLWMTSDTASETAKGALSTDSEDRNLARLKEGISNFHKIWLESRRRG